ncbi:hypothetical protein E5720_18060 [Rhodococcus sp. PAMC28707]|uniref:hypothetical protein n=1 Tax=unclassified Rhodococcus (in: high G+C Gram-positive bacteria) TaxID=192944 RepID=UPI00109E091D|nr:MULTISPECIES: hypothetical protein [unclassified Rhodococcus (in: high G+C Gram-positive bacteria)]QCB51733.1 hypothetical protein E5769_17465 [Rhodococcus sp. PAMC28705]QCB60099.1 hypothetical protein E5720_18060 [Rhodococcus sp. PAMC28707]
MGLLSVYSISIARPRHLPAGAVRRLQPDVRASNWDLSLTERVFAPNERIEALRGQCEEQVMDDHTASPQ